jgi:flavin-dependent dehydrogenase
MPFDHDIVIVGGGPAGATTAIAVARAAPELAARTVVLERARFPRDKPCAGALGGRGDALLSSLGVVVDVPSVPIHGVSVRASSGEAAAAPGSIGRVVRRVEFDEALARAAVSLGVAVREGVRVTAIHDESGGGAIVETAEGPIRARVVVGCDGVGSVVRKALGAGTGQLRAQVVEVDTEPVAADRARGLIHFDLSDPRLSGYAWDFPTLVGGRELVCRGVYRIRAGSGAPEDERDVGAILDERLRAMGLAPDRAHVKRYAERGFEPASRLARGPMMLAGEAAGIDPATGEGIAQAIEYGVMAGTFVARRVRECHARVAVEGWADEVARSRLARDLRIRTHFMRLFHGSGRAPLERLLTSSPDLLHVGCQHFAAQRPDWLKLGRVAARGAAVMAASLVAP